MRFLLEQSEIFNMLYPSHLMSTFKSLALIARKTHTRVVCVTEVYKPYTFQSVSFLSFCSDDKIIESPKNFS